MAGRGGCGLQKGPTDELQHQMARLTSPPLPLSLASKKGDVLTLVFLFEMRSQSNEKMSVADNTQDVTGHV